MNKEFEKILKRLEELPHAEDDLWIWLSDAKKVVKEVAGEYNGGWIPCSERLPEKYTVLCCDRYGEILVGHPYFDEVSDTNYSAESENEMMYNCVAWQPLPEPYKESD